MAEELKKEKEGAQDEKEKRETEKEIEKSEPTLTEDDLSKTIKDLEDIIKAKKAPEPEEDEDDEDEDEDEDEEKSFTGNFDEDETLNKAIEVSDYLAALVDQTETSIDAVGGKISNLEKSLTKFDSKYLEALGNVGTLIKGLTDKIDVMQKAFDERLVKIEKTPVSAAKSIVKSGSVLEKSFAGDTGVNDSIEQLPRRKVAELLEKAVADGKIRDGVLFSYEGSQNYSLTQEQKELLKAYI
jgi:hypothetical protein